MKHLLIILISFLLLSSPVIGNNHKGETLYLWETSSGGEEWKGFGHNETHLKYIGGVKNGEPNGFGVLFYTKGTKYIGEWKNGEFIKGTKTLSDGNFYVGEFKYWLLENGTFYDKNGNINFKRVNGKIKFEDEELQKVIDEVNWEFVSIGTGTGDKLYYDKYRVRKNGKFLNFWELQDYIKPIGGYLSSIRYIELDCSFFQYKTLKLQGYKNSMGGGMEDFNITPPDELNYPPPNSMIEIMYKKICEEHQ